MSSPTPYPQGLGRKQLTAPVALVFALVLAAPAWAQTFTVIHNFAGGQDGSQPVSGLAIDKAGNFYGTASAGGAGFGTVFKLVRKNSAWVLNPLYSFAGGNDGAGPVATPVLGPNGTLYGSTAAGGGGGCSKIYEYSGCGTIFNLKPGVSACKTALCPWSETVIYHFAGGGDGAYPIGELHFDQSGNIFGTTADYLQFVSAGTVFELTPSGGGWTKSLVHRFSTSGSDGQYPASGVISDQASNLYGTTYNGGAHGNGTVYQLTPSGSGWSESILYSFSGSDGTDVAAGLVFDGAGNLYGGTTAGGTGGGTIFGLTPSGGGHWTLTVLNSFTGSGGPASTLIMDSAGNLYGTTTADGAYGAGNVFKLSRAGEGWVYTDVYDFTGGSDGASPIGSLVLDANGNLYGTAEAGGANGEGVIFELTP